VTLNTIGNCNKETSSVLPFVTTLFFIVKDYAFDRIERTVYVLQMTAGCNFGSMTLFRI